MFKYSKRSLDILATCHTDIRFLMHQVISLQIMDVQIISGLRTREQQATKVNAGFSKTLDSMHVKRDFCVRNSDLVTCDHKECQLSLAVDIAPYPIDWKDHRRFDYLAGIVVGEAAKWNIGIRWGGDWDGDSDLSDQRFNDLGHFELLEKNLEEAPKNP